MARLPALLLLGALALATATIGQEGDAGAHGSAGDKGDAGVHGSAGRKGDANVIESPEPAGLPGPRGPKGYSGRDGLPGLPGRPGAPGPSGPQGSKGDAGSSCRGSDGLPGLPGLSGLDGQKGDKGVNGRNGAPGLRGLDGQKGEKGERGPPGMCPPAPAAFKGDVGPPGPPGPPGSLVGCTVELREAKLVVTSCGEEHPHPPRPIVPTAPEELAVYRWNQAHVFLRWGPPALPDGQLRNYNVSVDGLPFEQVSPDSKCPAWPALVCHVVRRPSSRQPFSNMTVVVVATDDKLQQRGDEARIAAVTLDSKPDAVVGLKARPAIDSVGLQWGLPLRLNGDLANFGVMLTRLVDGSSDEVIPDPAPLNLQTTEELPLYEIVVRGLQPGSTYRATVRCDATGGSTAASVEFTTLSFRE